MASEEETALPRPPQNKERVLFRGENVKVTPTQLNVGDATYSMAAIVSTRTATTSGSRAVAIAATALGLIFLGLAFLSGNSAGFLLGVVVTVIGLALFAGIKPTHRLWVTMANGEVQAIASHSRHFVLRVRDAINQAISSRG